MDINKGDLETKLYINGSFVQAKSGKKIKVINPSTGEVIAQVAEAGKQNVQLAIESARRAFDEGPWRKLTAYQRGQIIDKIGHILLKKIDQIATIESLNTGKPFEVCKAVDIQQSARTFHYYAGWCDKIVGKTYEINGPFQGFTFKQPVGVVGQIIPWNMPILMMAWKLAPALAAGCTIVMKLSELTPLSALKLARYFKQCGLPDGVVNFVPGYGSQAGDYLSKSPLIDKIAFTGSTKIGYQIIKESHVDNLKRITLELGGKSGNIIFQDADLDVAIPQCCVLFFNAGQVCIANSRTFVHESIYDEFIKKLLESIKDVVVGAPFEQSGCTRQCTYGPLISQRQLNTVLNYIESGKEQGAKILTGGTRKGSKGYFIQPTIFVDVKDQMKIAKQQIFGPVMCIFKFKTEEQVIKRVNDSKYGLGAGIVTTDLTRAFRVSSQLKAGSVYVNTFLTVDATAPFGGYKDSGIGRQMGQQGINTYLQTKSVIIKK